MKLLRQRRCEDCLKIFQFWHNPNGKTSWRCPECRDPKRKIEPGRPIYLSTFRGRGLERL